MPFEANNLFGGSKQSGRKKNETVNAVRDALFSRVSPDMLASAGEVLVNRMQTGDAGAAAVMMPYLLGKPIDPAVLELNDAKAELLRAQAGNVRLEGQKLKLEIKTLELEHEKLTVSIEHERLTMQELRKRIELYFAQFVTPEMFQQFTNAYMQRALSILQNMNEEQFQQLAAKPDGLAELKSLLGVQFEAAVETTIKELPAFGEALASSGEPE